MSAIEGEEHLFPKKAFVLLVEGNSIYHAQFISS